MIQFFAVLIAGGAFVAGAFLAFAWWYHEKLAREAIPTTASLPGVYVAPPWHRGGSRYWDGKIILSHARDEGHPHQREAAVIHEATHRERDVRPLRYILSRDYRATEEAIAFRRQSDALARMFKANNAPGHFDLRSTRNYWYNRFADTMARRYWLFRSKAHCLDLIRAAE